MIRAFAILALLLSADRVAAQTHAQADVTVCFVPAERCTGQIVAALDGARTEIRVQAFAFSSRPIAAALVAAHQRGVDVQLVLDRSNQRFRGGVLESVAAAGIPVFIDWQPAIAHSRLMIVDRHLVRVPSSPTPGLGGKLNPCWTLLADPQGGPKPTKA